MWDNTVESKIILSNNGLNLNMTSTIRVKNSNFSTFATIILEKYSNGRWSTEASWTVSDTGNIVSTKNYYGTKGVKYRARLRATVNGETSTAYSSSIQL